MTMTTEPFQKIALVGIGLIGSSISLAAKRGGLARSVVGTARTQATVDTALELGLIEAGSTDLCETVRDADLIVLCVPVGICGAIAEQMAPVLKPGVIITDVGSVKASVVRDVAKHLPDGVHFVPGHPIAGTEQSGPEAGFAELFDDRWCILTPTHETCPNAVARLRAFWEELGSHVEEMTPEHHDLVLAITSHVPHLIAFNIVNTAATLERVTNSEVIKFSAGGFRDFTRIAASDPVMWRDVFLNNKDAVLEMLRRYTEDLTVLQNAISSGDAEVLEKHFSDARSLRRGIIEAGQDTPRPDFGRVKVSANDDRDNKD